MQATHTHGYAYVCTCSLTAAVYAKDSQRMYHSNLCVNAWSPIAYNALGAVGITRWSIAFLLLTFLKTWKKMRMAVDPVGHAFAFRRSMCAIYPLAA